MYSVRKTFWLYLTYRHYVAVMSDIPTPHIMILDWSHTSMYHSYYAV